MDAPCWFQYRHWNLLQWIHYLWCFRRRRPQGGNTTHPNFLPCHSVVITAGLCGMETASRPPMVSPAWQGQTMAKNGQKMASWGDHFFSMFGPLFSLFQWETNASNCGCHFPGEESALFQYRNPPFPTVSTGFPVWIRCFTPPGNTVQNVTRNGGPQNSACLNLSDFCPCGGGDLPFGFPILTTFGLEDQHTTLRGLIVL